MGTVTAAAAAALALGLLGGRLLWKTSPPEPPRYHRLTFRRGPIWSARFAPDGHTVVYGAQWDGTAAPQLYSTRVESPESSRLDLPTADVRSISKTGDMLLLDLKNFTTGYARTGTLSQAPISGSAARELLEDVGDADWAPDGVSFAVVRAPGWHYRLEFPAGKVLLETSSWISEPHVSPKGDAIAFFDHPLFGDDRGAVALLDLKTGAKKTLAAGFDSLQGMAWSTAGDLLYFAGASRGNARALRTVTPSGEQRVLATTPTGLALQDVSKDGRVLFIQRNARLGVVGLLPGQTRERELSVLDWPYHPLLASDGATMVVTEQGDGGGDGYSVYLRRLDVASSPVRLGEGEAMALSPDGAWVLARLIRSIPSQMQLLPTRAGQARPFPKDSLEHEVGWFFPDGKRILFVGHEPGRPLRTFVQDLDGGPARAVTPEGVEAELLGADGTSLVIRAGDKRLASMPVAGGPATPIAGTEPGDEPLAWAGDGRSLFVAPKRRQPPAQVYRVDGATARRELWKEFTPSDTAGLRSFVPAAASADGKTLLFHYSGSLSELYVAEGIAPKGSSR
jgi:Tol biopolymer transport system component